MQNLSQNEFNQIEEMCGLSSNELEHIAKIRRMKNDKRRVNNISFKIKTKHS